MVVTLYMDKCEGITTCSLDATCILVCALDAITNKNNFPFIDEMVCTSCGLCVMNCPNEALSK